MPKFCKGIAFFRVIDIHIFKKRGSAFAKFRPLPLHFGHIWRAFGVPSCLCGPVGVPLASLWRPFVPLGPLYRYFGVTLACLWGLAALYRDSLALCLLHWRAPMVPAECTASRKAESYCIVLWVVWKVVGGLCTEYTRPVVRPSAHPRAQCPSQGTVALLVICVTRSPVPCPTPVVHPSGIMLPSPGHSGRVVLFAILHVERLPRHQVVPPKAQQR